jgi:hypothetical protein
MTKANLITKQGTRVSIEGAPGDVAALIDRLDGDSKGERNSAGFTRGSKRKIAESEKVTPINLISSLIQKGFFRKPKDLASVKAALEELGHYYPRTTLSPALLRLVRKRQLRRLRDKQGWMYTG